MEPDQSGDGLHGLEDAHEEAEEEARGYDLPKADDARRLADGAADAQRRPVGSDLRGGLLRGEDGGHEEVDGVCVEVGGAAEGDVEDDLKALEQCQQLAVHLLGELGWAPEVEQVPRADDAVGRRRVVRLCGDEGGEEVAQPLGVDHHDVAQLGVLREVHDRPHLVQVVRRPPREVLRPERAHRRQRAELHPRQHRLQVPLPLLQDQLLQHKERLGDRLPRVRVPLERRLQPVPQLGHALVVDAAHAVPCQRELKTVGCEVGVRHCGR